MHSIPRYIGFLSLVLLLAAIVVPVTKRRLLGGRVSTKLESVAQFFALLLILFFIAVLLTSCADKPTKLQSLEDVVLVPPTPTKVDVPEETLKPCGKIPRLAEQPYKEGEVLTYIQSNVTAQSDCRRRQKDAVKTIRRAFNIEVPPIKVSK